MAIQLSISSNLLTKMLSLFGCCSTYFLVNSCTIHSYQSTPKSHRAVSYTRLHVEVRLNSYEYFSDSIPGSPSSATLDIILCFLIPFSSQLETRFCRKSFANTKQRPHLPWSSKNDCSHHLQFKHSSSENDFSFFPHIRGSKT